MTIRTLISQPNFGPSAWKFLSKFNFISAAKEQNKDLQIQLESKSSLLKDLSQQNADFEVKVETIKAKLEEKTSEKEDVEKRICLMQTEHEKDKSVFEDNVKDLQNANELLQKSKLELQKISKLIKAPHQCLLVSVKQMCLVIHDKKFLFHVTIPLTQTKWRRIRTSRATHRFMVKTRAARGRRASATLSMKVGS